MPSFRPDFTFIYVVLLGLLPFRNQNDREPYVVEAANEIRNYCFTYRDQTVAGIIVAGYDDKYGGQVYQIPLGGMCMRSPYAIGGSGSSYVQGFIHEHFKHNMSRAEAVEFVRKSKFNY